ncbi:putative leucine-rich repeat domain, L domain-containing protein [Medicago truncatula]|nr:putative leucine-rich repeat domain, L domain-containing protein [Medicago truncatula]
MHDLLQEMGREIVNQESINPGKRSRLWRAKEISDILKENKGTEVVEGIIFDTTEVGDLYLKSDSFRRMANLRYLKIHNISNGSICNVHFPDGLEWLSDKLRATNLGRASLCQCESLRQLHPSIFSLPRLTFLDLGGCITIESLKTNIHSKSLRELLLDGCSSLTEFSVTLEEITELFLRGTAIRELSSSIWRNTKLTSLSITKCNKLNIVGNKLSDDHGLGSVTQLDLSGCTEINALSLWSILDGIRSLKRLKLNECCNLECLPENIQNHIMLEWLELDDCRKLVSLTELLLSLLYLKAVNCTYLDTDFIQWSLLSNRSQKFIEDRSIEDEGVIDAFSFLPGAQVPLYFDFQTTEASITILPIPKSDFTINHHALHCIILECGKEVDRSRISHNYLGTLISDHVLICWHGYNRQENGSNDIYNLSFQFIHQDPNEELWWSKEGIKGCGVLPVWEYWGSSISN